MNKWEKLRELLIIKMRLEKSRAKRQIVEEIARVLEIMDFLEEQENEHKKKGV